MPPQLWQMTTTSLSVPMAFSAMAWRAAASSDKSSRAANARHLLGVDGVAMSVELSGQSGHMDGGVPCAGDEDNLGFRHGELLRGGMRWM
jgi:hypothetical protein